jgi:hypothetical protein
MSILEDLKTEVWGESEEEHDKRVRQELRERQVQERKAPVEVVVADLDIHFSSLVGLMVKASFAAIPAVIILAIIWTFVGGFFMALVFHR